MSSTDREADLRATGRVTRCHQTLGWQTSLIAASNLVVFLLLEGMASQPSSDGLKPNRWTTLTTPDRHRMSHDPCGSRGNQAPHGTRLAAVRPRDTAAMTWWVSGRAFEGESVGRSVCEGEREGTCRNVMQEPPDSEWQGIRRCRALRDLWQ